MDTAWFTQKDFSALELTRFDSIARQRITARLQLEDAESVRHIVARIEAIPADGDKLKSFGGSARLTTATFTCEGGAPRTVEIYNGRFKTPSTGFNSAENAAETSLAADFENLLAPALGKDLLRVPGLALMLGNLSITYERTETTPQPPDGPTLGPTSNAIYAVRGSTGQAQTLRVFSGQLPPQPLPFSVDGKKYILNSDWQKNNVHASYFQIVAAPAKQR